MMKRTKQDAEVRRQDFLLWVAILSGPILWLVQFQARYSLVAWTCSSDKSFVLPIIGIVFLLLAAGGGVLSWRIWVRTGRTWPEDVTGLPLGRVQFMSILGVMLNTLFALIIIAQIIPDFIFGPCLD
jgi:hypothetical protein